MENVEEPHIFMIFSWVGCAIVVENEYDYILGDNN